MSEKVHIINSTIIYYLIKPNTFSVYENVFQLFKIRKISHSPISKMKKNSVSHDI